MYVFTYILRFTQTARSPSFLVASSAYRHHCDQRVQLHQYRLSRGPATGSWLHDRGEAEGGVCWDGGQRSYQPESAAAGLSISVSGKHHALSTVVIVVCSSNSCMCETQSTTKYEKTLYRTGPLACTSSRAVSG